MPLGGSFQRKSCFRQKKPKKELPLNCPTIDVIIPLGWEWEGHHSKLAPPPNQQSREKWHFPWNFFSLNKNNWAEKVIFLNGDKKGQGINRI
jgi:hypothetical protein